MFPVSPVTDVPGCSQGPWRSLEDVEFATLAWVHWFNTTRLLERLGYLPPAEFETQHYQTTTPQAMQAVA
jgi:putative transposase